MVSKSMIIKLIFSTLIALTTVGFIEPTWVLAKSYSIDRFRIRAELLTNGNLLIREARTYTFKGRFTWADYRLPLEKVGVVRNFELRDEEGQFIASSDESPGTYQMQFDNDEFYVKWFYSARNESRTFVLSYEVTEVATLYDDIAVLYYKFIGEANPKRVKQVDITLKLPQPADTKNVRAWAHGPLWGELRFDRGLLTLSVSPLPAETFWEIRTLLPTNWLPDATVRKPGQVKESIIQEEEQWARQANEKRREAAERLRQQAENERKAWPFAIALAGCAFLSWGALYFKYGRGFKVPYHNKMDSAIPEDLPPTLAGYLYFQKQVHGGLLVATLLDLARRGYISIEQKPVESSGWGKSNKRKFTISLKDADWQAAADLRDYERDLLRLTFTELANRSSSVEFETFKKNKSTVRKWFSNWKKMISAHFEGQPYWDKISVRGTTISAVVSVVISGLGILLTIVLGKPGALAIFAGAVCFGLSFTILRYTPEIKLKRKKLDALRNYLKKFDSESSGTTPVLQRIQEYLVYAIALGVGEKALEKLIGIVPEEQSHIFLPWYIASLGHTDSGGLSAALTSLVSTATSTMSSSTGAGGGAAVGGGGGAGGAAGGAG